MPLAYGLIEPAELPLPNLPAQLDGMRIAHISDLHIRRPARIYQKLANQLTSMRLDLVVLTGDYIESPGQEQVALDVLQDLLGLVTPRYGAFGVFGNHDTLVLRELFETLPVRWLNNQTAFLDDRPVEIVGLDHLWENQPDPVAMLMQRPQPPDQSRHRLKRDEHPLRLMICHHPEVITTAADLHMDLLLAGHTHGGQCRLPTGHALVNSSDLPLALSSGLLRHRNTLAMVSRGVGFTGWVPRLFCRPHVPVYTLRKRTMPGQYTDAVVNLRSW